MTNALTNLILIPLISLLFLSLLNTAEANSFQIASKSALVFDLETQKVLYNELENEILPIASITKLMTALIVLEDSASLDEKIEVKIDQTKELNAVFSRVKVGSYLSRRDLLKIMLMSSENRAAAALAHNYSKGYGAFIKAMNDKAQLLGMKNTKFTEPTGLSDANVSTAVDLTKLLIILSKNKQIQEMSTIAEYSVGFSEPNYSLPFRNTNHLIFSDKWKILLTKTGFTNPAGHCLVMIANINDKPVTLVILNAFGKQTHFGDANRLKAWLEKGEIKPIPQGAIQHKKN
ncbi:D-alanyl-D-alanine endopeptidase [Thorsellia kenyensis]|uniref:D-alanyl-D-alanine endopeptidase n=1 Tax=Thorsellia kenyensis TaxID=1549888 RepID=A0ABV6CDN2_9GAMM